MNKIEVNMSKKRTFMQKQSFVIPFLHAHQNQDLVCTTKWVSNLFTRVDASKNARTFLLGTQRETTSLLSRSLSQRESFIRQPSKKNNSLHFTKYVVNLSRKSSFKPNTQQPNQSFAWVHVPNGIKQFHGDSSFADTETLKWLKRKKSSIFSFDFKYDQFLFANNHFYRLNLYRKLGYLYETNLDKMSFLSSDLSNLALSLKTYTFLKQKGIHKIGSLIPYSPKALLQLLNRNKDMFAEVKRCLLLIAICGDPRS